MAKLQSTLPDPVPAESLSVVASAVCAALSVPAGTLEPPDHTAEARLDDAVCVSPVSESVNVRVPVGVVSRLGDPVVSACSATEPESGPLVNTGALLVPRIVIVTVCVAVAPEGSVTFTS